MCCGQTVIRTRFRAILLLTPEAFEACLAQRSRWPGGEFQNFKGPAIVTYGATATATATVTGMTLESDWCTVEVAGGSTVTLSNCTVKQTDAVRPQGLTENEEAA